MPKIKFRVVNVVTVQIHVPSQTFSDVCYVHYLRSRLSHPKREDRVIRAIKPQGPSWRLAKSFSPLIINIYLTSFGMYTSLENVLLIFQFSGITIPIPEYDRIAHDRCVLVHTLCSQGTPDSNFIVPTLSVPVTSPL